MKENILVIGSTGFIGSFLRRELQADGASASGSSDSTVLDITDSDSLRRIFEKGNYHTVINCAGMTGVDACERDPLAAFRANALSAGNLSEAAERYSFRLIHISTDYVFDGRKGNYSEADRPSPVNVYGQTKLYGEKMIDLNNSIILRVSTPFGENVSGRKMTFIEFVLQKLMSGQPVDAAIDQITNPSFLPDILEFIKVAIDEDITGLYHLGVVESVSRYSFCMDVARVYGLDQDLVRPVSIDDLGMIAKRPKNTSFNLMRVKGIYKPHGLSEAIEKLRFSTVHP